MRIFLVALFSATVVVAGAGPASAQACTGKTTNVASSNWVISAVTVNGSLGILPGTTRWGGVANPITGFFTPATARVDYYTLDGTTRLATHFPVPRGTYSVNTCHWAVLTVH